jgi:DNA-binding transcriptional LysR family regulator
MRFERVDQAKVLAQQAGRGDIGFLRVGFTGSAAFNPTVTTVLREYRSTWPKIELILEENRTSVLPRSMARVRLSRACCNTWQRMDPLV